MQADRPKATQHLLQNRLQKAGIVANSLAAYFKERSAAELEYTKRLQKLAAKPLVTNPNSNLAFNAEGDDGLDKVLSNLEIELAEVIRIHEQAAKRFETQLSDTLRDAKVDTVGDGPINAAASDVSGSIRDYEEVSNRLSKVRPGPFHRYFICKRQSKLRDDVSRPIAKAVPPYLARNRMHRWTLQSQQRNWLLRMRSGRPQLQHTFLLFKKPKAKDGRSSRRISLNTQQSPQISVASAWNWQSGRSSTLFLGSLPTICRLSV